MDELSLVNSIETNKEQLAVVETALIMDSKNVELLELRTNLQELINLTEESLLSLKKKQLLDLLGMENMVASVECNPGNLSTNGEMNEKNTLMQSTSNASLSLEDSSATDSIYIDSSDSEENDNMSDDDNDDDDESKTELEQLMNELVGTKCRVPYSLAWGQKRHYNAVIMGANFSADSENESRVNVMLCNPTHLSLVPCPYYFEGRCKFNDEQCRMCHGIAVNLSEVQEYLEPDLSQLKMESKCLAKCDDGVWRSGIVVDCHDRQAFSVMLDNDESVVMCDLQDIIPDGMQVSEAEEIEDVTDKLYADETVDNSSEEMTKTVNLNTIQTTDALGQWETHTKGIGSKLMAKMGYVVGEGLGKTSQGRAEPVPIQLLPKGKSLDKIMELKAAAADGDLFNAMKKLVKKTKKQELRNAKIYKGSLAGEHEPSVFSFINKNLVGKKGKSKSISKKSGTGQHFTVKEVNERDLKDKSEKHLNIQLFKTHEEVKNVEREIERLRDRLQWNNERNPTVAKSIKHKLTSMESYLQKLRSSEGLLQLHKTRRTDHKKLTTF